MNITANKTKYEEFRDKLIRLEADQASIKRSNEAHCGTLKLEIEALTSLDPELAELHNIDMAFLKNIDLKKLISDPEYHSIICAHLGSEMEKICTLLEGVLK